MNTHSLFNAGSFRTLSKAMLLATGVAVAATVRADIDLSKPWTSVGSAGTVDEAGLQKVLLHLPTAELPRDTKTSATIRYNVTAVGGVNPGSPTLAVRFKDTGPGSRVKARLIEHDLNTGSGRVKVTFDSDLFPASTISQLQSVFECSNFVSFDFENKAYYIDVTLIQNDTTDRAAIEALKVSSGICIE